MKKKRIFLGAFAATVAMAALASCATKTDPVDTGSKTTDTTSTTVSTDTTTDTTVSTDVTTDTASTTVSTDTTSDTTIDTTISTDTTSDTTIDTTILTDTTIIDTTTTDPEVSKAHVILHNVNPDDLTEVKEYDLELDQIDIIDGSKYAEFKDEDKVLSCDYKEFEGWFSDEEFKSSYSVESAITEDIELWAKWGILYENVTQGFATSASADGSIESISAFLTDLTNAGKISNTYIEENYEYGAFKFGNKVRPESSGTFNIQGSKIEVNITDHGTLTVAGFAGASSNKTSTLTITAPDGTQIFKTEELGSKVENNPNTCTIDTKDYGLGTYTISTVNSIRINKLVLSQVKEKSKQTAIEASISETDFVVGTLTNENVKETIKNNISAKAIFANGNQEQIKADDFDIDVTNVKLDEAGEYTVTVSYNGFTADVKVYMYEVDSINLEEYIISNSCTASLRKVYLKDSTLDTSNIVVSCVAKCGDKEITRLLDASVYTIGEVDLTTTGTKTVTVTYSDTISTSFDINVVNNVVTEDMTELTINVNPQADIEVSDTNISFKTINDAVNFMNICGIKSSATKIINIASGDYEEKVSITVPNVTLNGEDFNTTIIHYLSCAGVKDINGTIYGNSGSAVVYAAKGATNFKAENLTIRNDYDTYEKYQAAKAIYGSGSNATQALALFNNADKSVVENCDIISAHDTLYTQGRQQYTNCTIKGTTDFIFGVNTSVLFKDCDIVAILSADPSVTNAQAYVGCNYNTSDDYNGYVFDGCNFTGEGTGSVGVGRTWQGSTSTGATMKQIVMNSTFDSTYITDVTKRYTNMNTGIYSMADKVKEYNNTGEGAVTTGNSAENTNQFSVLTEAPDLTDFFKVGDDTWDPDYVVVDNSVYFMFTGSEAASGTSYVATSADALEGSSNDFTIGEYTITVDATNGKFNPRATDVQINAGTTISFKVKAGTSVTIESYPNYHGYTITNVAGTAVAADSDIYSVYYKADATVTITATATCYLYSIQINPDAEAPTVKASYASYDGLSGADNGTNWTTDATATTKLNPVVGTVYDKTDENNKDYVALSNGTSIKTAKFDNGALKADLTVVFGTGTSGNDFTPAIQLLDASGNVIKTVRMTGFSSKKTTQEEITVESDVEFYYIAIVYDGTSTTKDTSKNFAIVSVDVTLYVVE